MLTGVDSILQLYRERLQEMRQQLMAGVKAIDNELTRLESRGTFKAHRTANGRPASVSRGRPRGVQSTRGFIETYLVKHPGAAVNDLLKASPRPLSRQNLHGTLFYMRSKGIVSKRGEGTSAGYSLTTRRRPPATGRPRPRA